MKITTVTLIATLALGSAFTFAQDSATPVKNESAKTQATTNAPAPVTKEEFHVNRMAAINSGLSATVTSRQLLAMPLENRDALDSINADR